jgi:hypothetical protein
MTNVIPRAIADVELQLAAKIDIGGTSLTLNSANDDDGNALPAGLYCFTLDSGTSNKEYLIGQLNGVNVTSVKTVNRQGAETSGAARAHRVGSPCIVTNFATLQRVADILRGALDLDGASPVSYDTQPTLSDGKQLATVQYVLDTVSGGSVSFDQQTITGTAGESIVAGDEVYFKTSDQEWYKTDADTAATVEGVQLGIALGTGSNGVAITGGIQIAGTWATTGLTAGALYYASNTAGARATSAGTTSQIVGLALSTTKLLIIPRNPQTPTTNEKAAMAGGAAFGTPSESNKYITEAYNASASGITQVVVFTASGTWTKDAGLKYVIVEVQAPGGGGQGDDTNASTNDSSECGSGGGYSRKLIPASLLAATETVTVPAGGAASASNTSPSAGTTGSAASFGSLVSATGGTGGGGGRTPGAGSSGDFNLTGQKDTSVSTTHKKAGSSFLGIGGENTLNTLDTPSTGYGAGGVGGKTGRYSATNGQPGIIIVTEYYS